MQIHSENEAVELDEMDIAILGFLKNDGRRSFTDMANDMNVSVGMIRNRYNRLVEKNILHIIGWVDPVKAGLHAYARVMLKIRPSDRIKAIAEQIAALEEVSFLAITTGSFDIETNLTCRDNAHLLDVLHEKIHKIDGVFETSTTMYLDVLKWAAHDIGRTSTATTKEIELKKLASDAE
jgi:Lrp/AsnC family transcriptional regulator for asnA, asnC and gidA